LKICNTALFLAFATLFLCWIFVIIIATHLVVISNILSLNFQNKFNLQPLQLTAVWINYLNKSIWTVMSILKCNFNGFLEIIQLTGIMCAGKFSEWEISKFSKCIVRWIPPLAPPPLQFRGECTYIYKRLCPRKKSATEKRKSNRNFLLMKFNTKPLNFKCGLADGGGGVG
jgi:hypothetical protein